MSITTNDTAPALWIGCLAAYNNGRLHGEWVDATDADTIREAIARILATSPVPGAEEPDVMDHQGFGSYEPSLHDLEEVAEVAQNIEEHGEPFLAWLSDDPNHNTDASEFEDAFIGEFASVREFGEHFLYEVEDLSQVPERLRGYLDAEAYGSDLLMGDMWETSGFYFWHR